MKSTSHGLGCALLFFAALSGCVSSSNVTESTPALICDPDGCQPNQQRVDSSWGPIKLDGGISIFNIASISSWGEEIGKADEKATRELKRKIDEIQCGDACDKIIQTTSSISLSLNPDGMNFEEEECQAAFHSTVEVSASSFSCTLAYIELLGEVNGAADALAEQCKEISPNCGAGSVELNMSSTDEESPVSSEEENGTFTCTVTIRANVLVRCAGGDTSITNPEASGENVAYVECKKPEAAACEQALDPTQTQAGMFEHTDPPRQSDINSSQY